MTKLQSQLKAVSKSLSNLSKQVENASKLVEKLPKAKTDRAAKKSPSGKAASPKKTPKKKPAAEKKSKPSVIAAVHDMIGRSRKGVTVGSIRKKTGLDPRQISNALYRLTKGGEIQTKGRGLYVRK